MEGISTLIDLLGVNNSKFHNREFLSKLLLDAINQSGLSLITTASHQFEEQLNNKNEGGGATLFALLKESHISIHTWPEKDKMVIDIFTCGAPKNAELAMSHLLNNTTYTKKEVRKIERGIF